MTAFHGLSPRPAKREPRTTDHANVRYLSFTGRARPACHDQKNCFNGNSGSDGLKLRDRVVIALAKRKEIFYSLRTLPFLDRWRLKSTHRVSGMRHIKLHNSPYRPIKTEHRARHGRPRNFRPALARKSGGVQCRMFVSRRAGRTFCA